MLTATSTCVIDDQNPPIECIGREWGRRVADVSCTVEGVPAIVPGSGINNIIFGRGCLDLPVHAVMLAVLEGSPPSDIFLQTDAILKARTLDACQAAAAVCDPGSDGCAAAVEELELPLNFDQICQVPCDQIITLEGVGVTGGVTEGGGEVIRKFKGARKLCESSYLVETDLDADAVYETLVTKLTSLRGKPEGAVFKKDERLYVVPVRARVVGFGIKATNDWLNARAL
jgi:hypothetical protein